jgi:hypothetical protein
MNEPRKPIEIDPNEPATLRAAMQELDRMLEAYREEQENSKRAAAEAFEPIDPDDLAIIEEAAKDTSMEASILKRIGLPGDTPLTSGPNDGLTVAGLIVRLIIAMYLQRDMEAWSYDRHGRRARVTAMSLGFKGHPGRPGFGVIIHGDLGADDDAPPPDA